MAGMEVKLIKPPQMSHTCGTSKPCQSAQTSELVSIYITYIIYITFRRKTTSQRSDFKFHVWTIIRLQILHLHSNSFKDHSNTLGERAILSSIFVELKIARSPRVLEWSLNELECKCKICSLMIVQT